MKQKQKKPIIKTADVALTSAVSLFERGVDLSSCFYLVPVRAVPFTKSVYPLEMILEASPSNEVM